MGKKITVVVVDDHSLFRTGVMQSLALDDAIKVVGEGSSGAEAIDLVRLHRPDILLLDISMPGNGIQAAYEILKMPRAPRIVMLTVSESDDDVMRALEAGVVGYVLKGIKATELITAVKNVAAGDSFISPNLTLRLLSGTKTKPSALSSLTHQEERTLRLVAMGLSNREVGNKLGVLEQTVKYHMTNIKKKLKVRNRVEATLLARQEWTNFEPLVTPDRDVTDISAVENRTTERPPAG